MRLFNLLILLFMISCERTPPKQENSVRLNLYSEPTSLDPRKTSEETASTILLNLYEGLMRIDPSGKVVPGIAKSVAISPDGLTYTFYLRKSKWSDGTALTAHDFVYAWTSALDPDFPCVWAHLFYPIKGARRAKVGKGKVAIRALNDQILEVKLEHPTPYFLALTANSIYYPVQRDGSASNGPFRLALWEPWRQMILERNPHYWAAKEVALDQLFLEVVEDATTELYMYQQGELDRAGAPFSILPLDPVPILRMQRDFIQRPVMSLYWYQFNTNVIPFNNAKVRRAFSLALSRENIVSHITKDTHLPATSFMHGLAESRKIDVRANSEEAYRLFHEGLKELGLTVEDLPEIELSYNTSDDHLKIAQAIQQQWRDTFDLSIKLVGSDWGVHLSHLRSGEYQIGRLSWYAQVEDPFDFLQQLQYQIDWSDSRYDQLLEEIKRHPDNRGHLITQAEKLLQEEMPLIPLCFMRHNALQDPRLKGVIHSHLGRLDFRWAYWQEEK